MITRTKKIMMGLIVGLMMGIWGGGAMATEVIKPELTIPGNNFSSLEGNEVKAVTFEGETLRAKVSGVIVTATAIVKRGVIPLFVLVIVILGVKMATAGDEEKAKKVRDQLIFGIGGMLLIIMANVIVNVMFLGGTGENEAGGTVRIWESGGEALDARGVLQNEISGIINFAGWGLAIAAMIMIIVYGVLMIFADGDEEEFGRNKKGVMFAVIGLVLVGMATTITKIMFGGLDQFSAENPELGPDLATGLNEITGLLNFALSFVGVIALVMIIWAGFTWMTAGEDEGRISNAKQIMVAAIIGIIVILSAFALVNTFLG